MAITRAQQAKQMLQDGGMLVSPSTTGKRPGYRGDDARKSAAAMGKGAMGTDRKGREDAQDQYGDRYQVNYDSSKNISNRGGDQKVPPPKPKIDPTINNQFLPPSLMIADAIGTKIKDSKLGRFLDTKARMEYLQNLKDEDDELYQATVDDLAKLGYAKRDVELYGPEDKFAGRDIETFTDLYEDQAKSILNTVKDSEDGSVGTLYDDYLDSRKLPDNDGDGIQDPCKGPNPPAYCFVGIRSVEKEPEKKIEEAFSPNLRLLAGGGMAERAPYEGGIMDFESARQMYGLGKLVKKVTRTVKKIAKSPIGKAAILAAGGYALGGGFGTAVGGFKKATLMSRLGLGGFENVGGNRIFQKNLLGKFITSPAGIITGTSLGAGLMTPEEEDDDEEQYAGADLPFPVDYYLSGQYPPNMRLAAKGGLMRAGYQEGSKEPVAKKTMPLLDMDGMEKDYREEGGFVPIGRMEKADDVAARLSKNEFVFTADAVRNAGDGDVDLGAEKMYNMMKNLEAGGDVSEESQGMDGARKMFQTSQRLEEVI